MPIIVVYLTKLVMSNNITKDERRKEKSMMTASVVVKQIASNMFQIIGSCNDRNVFTRIQIFEQVVKFANAAERNGGIPQQKEEICSMPADLMIHATYMFMSQTDIETFVRECGHIT